MKVMILADGGSIHSRRILDWHLAQGCDVTFVDFEDPMPSGGERYRYLPFPGLPGGSHLHRVIGRRAAGRLTAWAVARRLRRLWSSIRPDVVHLYQIDSRAYHCHLAGIHPLVLSSWGTDINQHFTGRSDDLHRHRTALAIAGADLVLADADDVIEKCVQLAGRPIATERMALGVDTDLFRPGYASEAIAWRTRAGITEDACVLFSIRALTPLYGHHQVLDAFARALPRLPRPAVLVFKAYNDQRATGYQDQLRRQAERLGVTGSIRWTGAVPFEELPALYAATDVIVNFPDMDGFPVTFLEAAACQRPVVTNRLPAYAGTLAERYFHLVEPGDIDGLAEALVAAIDRPPGLDSLREARGIVEREYGEQMLASRLMKVYRRVIAAASGASPSPGQSPSPDAARC